MIMVTLETMFKPRSPGKQMFCMTRGAWMLETGYQNLTHARDHPRVIQYRDVCASPGQIIDIVSRNLLPNITRCSMITVMSLGS